MIKAHFLKCRSAITLHTPHLIALTHLTPQLPATMAPAAISQTSDTLRIEMATLGICVVTVMVGSVGTTIFVKPGGQLQSPETSYYRYPGIERIGNKQRAKHKTLFMSVDKVALKSVRDVLTGTKYLSGLGHVPPRCIEELGNITGGSWISLAMWEGVWKESMRISDIFREHTCTPWERAMQRVQPYPTLRGPPPRP